MTEFFFEVFEGEKKLGKEGGGNFRLKLSFNNINQFAIFKHNFFYYSLSHKGNFAFSFSGIEHSTQNA